ncbi:hypothetical protein [Jidongwangia harbinensis]|uniref:hypothetical protein n=1 Tax=Jidongwangia harbinensis TaxID=2878561 RepID=UPI001CD9267F|nr:hypothetical protein [Jidongwangia harbinensis]MCA2213906.1 hypothetical protein [Jidongwangia harbinensis]
MTTEKEYQGLYDRVAGLREELVKRLSGDLINNPALGDALVKQVDDLLSSVESAGTQAPAPPDRGLAQLVGIGPEAARELGQARIPYGVTPYDETVTSERLVAVGDLYYIYQHERLGVFRVVRKLQELFRAGTVRLSGGTGAYGLYQFDRRDVLRYTHHDRLAAYGRVLGYGSTPAPRGGRRNAEFHRQFTQFVNQVTLFHRDKRISEVLRERSYDPSFGSIAVVRRAGLDLRNNLKFASFGHLNVLRVEVMQVLDEAFRILESDDVKRLFGADTSWDVLEEVLLRYFRQRLVTSPRQRMAVSGREVLRWLAQPHILQTSRAPFEALLLQIAEYAEEWLTSAEALGSAQRRPGARVLPFEGRAPLAVVPS